MQRRVGAYRFLRYSNGGGKRVRRRTDRQFRRGITPSLLSHRVRFSKDRRLLRGPRIPTSPLIFSPAHPPPAAAALAGASPPTVSPPYVVSTGPIPRSLFSSRPPSVRIGITLASKNQIGPSKHTSCHALHHDHRSSWPSRSDFPWLYLLRRSLIMPSTCACKKTVCTRFCNRMSSFDALFMTGPTFLQFLK